MNSLRAYALNHHIYEYKKGLRNMVLFTTLAENRNFVEERLKRDSIDYFIKNINHKGINVFFGDRSCIDVVRSFGCTDLGELNPAQDFILGILLGYDQLVQCQRYLSRIDVCDGDCENCLVNK